ncbi:MAG: hypothetical protein R3A13_05655 [Bdellovibrionota bacterium]
MPNQEPLRPDQIPELPRKSPLASGNLPAVPKTTSHQRPKIAPTVSVSKSLEDTWSPRLLQNGTLLIDFPGGSGRRAKNGFSYLPEVSEELESLWDYMQEPGSPYGRFTDKQRRQIYLQRQQEQTQEFHHQIYQKNLYGCDGGNATNPTAGRSAPNVKIFIAHPSSVKTGKPKDWIELKIEVTDLNNSIRTGFYRYKLSNVARIKVLLPGGAGGAGGIGGNGVYGFDGQDGSHYGESKHGSSGGAGGNGGAGTSGAPGGSGGKVLILASQENANLLLLFAEKPNVKGGKGGRAGKHGRPGAGGVGGSGADGYFDYRTRHVTKQVPYTTYENTSYSSGTTWAPSHSSGTRSVTKYRTETTTESYEVWIPGGNDGMDGSSGRYYINPLVPGKDGKPGSHLFLVRSKDNSQLVSRSKWRYDLDLCTARIRATGPSLAFEPGADAEIDQIRVKNNGAMELPADQVIIITVKDDHNVESLDYSIKLTKPLKPGEECVLEGAIPFRLSSMLPIPVTGRPKQTAICSLDAAFMYPRIRFPDFCEQTGFGIDIMYPVSLGIIGSDKSVRSGEWNKLEFAVLNEGKVPVGFKSGEEGRDRELQLRISTATLSGGCSGVEIRSEAIQEQKLSSREVIRFEKLPAGSTQNLAIDLRLPENSPAFSSAEVELGLSLGWLHDATNARIVQKERVKLVATPTYDLGGKQPIILVTNPATTAEEHLSWQKLADRYGWSLNIWDVGYNQVLDPNMQLANGKTLEQEWQGKTVVVLSNAYTRSNSTEKNVQSGKGDTQLMKAIRLHEAVTDHQMRLLFVGKNNVAYNALFLFVKAKNDRKMPDHTSVSRFRKQQSPRSASKLQQRSSCVIKVKHFLPPGVSVSSYENEMKLRNKAKQLLETLNRKYPERSYAVKIQPSKDQYSWFKRLSSRVSLGEIVVTRELNPSTLRVFQQQVSDEVLHSDKCVLSSASSQIEIAFFRTIPAAERASAIVRRVFSTEYNNQDSTEDRIFSSLLIDLASALSIYTEHRGLSRIHRQSFDDLRKLLEAIKESVPKEGINKKHPAYRFYLGYLQKLQYIINEVVPKKQRWLPTIQASIYRDIQKVLNEMTRRISQDEYRQVKKIRLMGAIDLKLPERKHLVKDFSVIKPAFDLQDSKDIDRYLRRPLSKRVLEMRE